MAPPSRFFIIRPDGTTSTVDAKQLATMRESGFIGPDDKVIPVARSSLQEPAQKPAPSPIRSSQSAVNKEPEPAPLLFDFSLDDMDTAPFDMPHQEQEPLPLVEPQAPVVDPKEPQVPEEEHEFQNLGDSEIDQAFSFATSRNFYQLDADRTEENFSLSNNDALSQPDSDISKRRPQSTPSHSSEYLYHIRHADGRVVGPFNELSIIERINKGLIDGSEDIADHGSSQFSPLKSHARYCPYILLHSPQAIPAEQASLRLTAQGIVSHFFDCAQRLMTGWLLVRHEDVAAVVPFIIGQPMDVISNQEGETRDEILHKLFLWDKGSLSVVLDPVAAGYPRHIDENLFALCRKWTSLAEGFSTARMLGVLGHHNRQLTVNPQPGAYFHRDDLTALENAVLEYGEKNATLHETLHGLTTSDTSREDVVHAVFLVLSAHLIRTDSIHQKSAISELKDKLLSDRFLELLAIDASSDQASVDKELSLLERRSNSLIDSLLMDDPERHQLQQRWDWIFQKLSHPASRYVLFKAQEKGNLGLMDDAVFYYATECEYLKSQVLQGFDQDRHLEVLPLAEHYFRVAPHELLPQVLVRVARVFSATTNKERQEKLRDLRKANRKFVEPYGAALAAETFLKAGDIRRARQIFNQFQHMPLNDQWLIDKKDALAAKLAQAVDMRVVTPALAMNLVWTMLVTLVVIAVLWITGIDLRLSRLEMLSSGISVFAWLRMGALLAAMLLGFGLLHGFSMGQVRRQFGKKIPIAQLVLMLVLGCLVGATNNQLVVFPSKISTLAYAHLFLYVVVDRLYFSGFMMREILRCVPKRWVSVLIATALYTLYYFSFYSVYYLRQGELALEIVFIAIWLGLLPSLIQAFTRSFSTGFVYMLAVQFSAMLVTQYFGAGHLYLLLEKLW